MLECWFSCVGRTWQGLYRLWDDKWKPCWFSMVSLALSQVIIIAFGIASAFVFDSPGTVAAILCSYVVRLAPCLPPPVCCVVHQQCCVSGLLATTPAVVPREELMMPLCCLVCHTPGMLSSSPWAWWA